MFADGAERHPASVERDGDLNLAVVGSAIKRYSGRNGLDVGQPPVFRKELEIEDVKTATGIAGPAGGSPEKPVGLVYIALADDKQTLIQKYQLQRERQIIRLRAARRALNMLRLYLIN